MPQGEVYLSRNYCKNWGSVTGSRNLYLVYGKTPLGERGGTGLAPDHKFYFKIEDLLKKWPEIDSPEVRKAITKQAATIQTIKKLESSLGKSQN